MKLSEDDVFLTKKEKKKFNKENASNSSEDDLNATMDEINSKIDKEGGVDIGFEEMLKEYGTKKSYKYMNFFIIPHIKSNTHIYIIKNNIFI